ncbi:MAG: hypothetical protein IJS46_06010 [Kiritimatiellae bacterium]|nr:hypothetical protein [Kiritimatiellia bacterium]
MQDNGHRFFASVVMPDRVGILRDATGAIFALGANIVDLRQSVTGGFFTLLAVCEFPSGSRSQEPEALAAITRAVACESAVVSFRPAPAVEPTAAGERYVAAFTGPDAPGRIAKIAAVFAAAGANVEDWRHDLSDPERTLTIGVVTLPETCAVEALRRDLEREMRPMKLSVSLLHENIFRATNEVGPIAALFGASPEEVSRNA